MKGSDRTARVLDTLDNIAKGTTKSKKDGTPFVNREGRLPAKPQGYYREFTVRPAPGVKGRGAERVVIGQGGEVYYTPNHYGSFVRIR